ncbi:MAG TPA: HNH endonuclease [Caulobacteraceae bacterium]|jgi:hypothetical protein|nr:HNH endonuclease [Caulobacteraceae bacterium]
MIPSTELEERIFESFGRCVFCKNEFPPEYLTDEHIVPKALSGDRQMILKGGSCRCCNNFANENYEQAALKANFLIPRILLELKRRSGKNRPPPQLPKVALGDRTMSGDVDEFNIALEAARFPPQWSIVAPEPAGLLRGVAATGDLKNFRIGILNLKLPREETAGFTVREPNDHTSFGLTICKMAFCYAIARKGLDRLDASDLRELLQFKRDDLYNFFGEVMPGENLHSPYLHRFHFRRRASYTTVIVHLLASFGGPAYEVVVGREA